MGPGRLESIGLTPRRVAVSPVVSMAGLGVVGGVLGPPLGVAAYRVVSPLTEHSARPAFPGSPAPAHGVTATRRRTGCA
ncbi:hypothetical protein AB0L59_22285 [Streptomyces sp. NPDC052109]|uniref:hypothetical protein n=1 Tax=Streptomyces sp. NPDC052109 TaxID=3155527 RepID=UPI00341FE714